MISIDDAYLKRHGKRLSDTGTSHFSDRMKSGEKRRVNSQGNGGIIATITSTNGRSYQSWQHTNDHVNAILTKNNHDTSNGNGSGDVNGNDKYESNSNINDKKANASISIQDEREAWCDRGRRIADKLQFGKWLQHLRDAEVYQLFIHSFNYSYYRHNESYHN
jgi:hypothetical protein